MGTKKKLQIMAISAVSCCCAVAADVTITVNDGDPDMTLTAADIAGLGASDNLVKQGGGRLIIDSAVFDASWVGAVGVSNGYLRVAHVDALGPAGAKGAVVADGATIEFDGSALGSSDLTCAKVAFEGEGADGESAIRVVGANWGHTKMAWTMTGDAAWGGTQSKSEHFKSGTQSIDMGGHTLTVRGDGTSGHFFYLQVANIFSNPGNIIVENIGQFTTEGTKFLGGDTHTLRFKTSSTWRITNNNRNDMTWKLVIDAGAWVSFTASAWVTKWPNADRGWSGPIEIAKGGTLSWSPNTHATQNPDGLIGCTISGPVSGEGSIWCGNNYLVLDNPSNTIANIANYQGHLYATSLSSVLPSFTNGTFKSYYLSAEGLGTFITVTADDTGPDCDAAKMYYLAHYPEAYLVSGAHPVANIYLDSDGNELTVSSPVELERCRYYVGAPYPGFATLTVEDGGALNAETHSNGVGIVLGLNLTNYAAHSRGILRLNAGGAITNRVSSLDNIQLPSPPRYSQGTFIIDGGDYYNNDTSWQYGMVGHQIGGYVQMLGGKWRSNGWTCFGHGKYGYGTFEMLGGTFTLPSGAVGIGSYGGSAHMYIGGTSTTDIYRIDTGFCVWGGASDTNAYGVVTIDDEAYAKVSITWLGAASDTTSILNLNGGQFVTQPTIFTGAAITNVQQMQSNQSSVALSNQNSYVNFNGGTIQFNYAPGTMNGYRIGRKVTIYKGGANINMTTAANNAGSGTFAIDLKAPTGKGVGSIPVPAAAAWEFTGSPLIKIEGDGWGASAFAQFDAERGLITNIVVTSPGCDYTWAKATLYRGGPTNDTEIVLDDYLVDNDTSGGVHWFGNGTYNISGSGEQRSTYCGPTKVSTGATVQYWTTSWYYPTNSPLVMDGGTCRFGSGGTTDDKLSLVTLTGLSGFGTVHAKGITTKKLGFDAAAFTYGNVLDLQLKNMLTLPVGTTLKIDNSELLASHRTERFTVLTTTGTIDSKGPIAIDSEGALDADWKVYIAADRIRIGYSKIGTSLVFR